MRKKIKNTSCEEVDNDLLAHIQSLSIDSLQEYRSWCSENGFSRKLNKHWRMRHKEREWFQRKAAQYRLSIKKNETRRPEECIKSIYGGNYSSSPGETALVESIYESYKTVRKSRLNKKSALRILLYVSKGTGLLQAQPVIPELGEEKGNTYVSALVRMACFAHKWVRPLEEWKPRSHNTRRQFSSLARHLFSRWDVPEFMDTVWFKGCSENGLIQQKWFIHLGKGENIRTANLPIPFSKRMAHYFMQAPAKIGSVESALIYGQVLAQKGTVRLASSIIAARIESYFTENAFWLTVIQWFVSNPMLDQSMVGPIVDFLHHHKYVGETIYVAPGRIEVSHPPQPNMTMKGRTPESLLKQVEAWHKQLNKSDAPPAEWEHCGIAEFDYAEGKEKSGEFQYWSIRELLSSRALKYEGRQMHHCVASYASSCASGRCSIWTLEIDGSGGRRKVLTLEVNNVSKQICQARGKYNELPTEKHRKILRRWAQKAGLTLASHL